MKIISKFQDYYDCGVAYGVDTNIYFKRETTLKNKSFGRYNHWRDTKLSLIEITEGTVSFCGKEYKYLLVKTSKSGEPIQIMDFNRTTCNYKFYYTEQDYLNDYPNHYIKVKGTWSNPRRLSEYFKVKEIPDTEFMERGIPYFIGNKNLPILKEYQFAKAVEPMRAFQEISMYLGKINHQEPECEIDDKYRMKGHGMDCMSYRKAPTKNKKDKKC